MWATFPRFFRARPTTRPRRRTRSRRVRLSPDLPPLLSVRLSVCSPPSARTRSFVCWWKRSWLCARRNRGRWQPVRGKRCGRSLDCAAIPTPWSRTRSCVCGLTRWCSTTRSSWPMAISCAMPPWWEMATYVDISAPRVLAAAAAADTLCACSAMPSRSPRCATCRSPGRM